MFDMTGIKKPITLEVFEEKYRKAAKVNVIYPAPYETGYAIVEYFARKGKPLKVVQYSVYGEELKTGEELICWQWLPSTNFYVVEKSFKTEAEAIARMKELKEQL